MIRGRDRFADLMRATRKAPAEMRPTRYHAPGLQAAREEAGLSVEELGESSGYGPGVIRHLESGGAAHSVTISRIASALGQHDLREIRNESETEGARP